MIEKDYRFVKEYWVVFTRGTHWVNKVLKKNFSHCYVVTRDQYNWIVINPTRLYLDVQIKPVPLDVDLAKLIRKPHDTVLKIEIYERASEVNFKSIGLINCVTHVKYILGLRVRAITPFRLYKKLLGLSQVDKNKHGIKSIKLVI